MSSQEGHQGLFRPFKASGHFNIPVNQHFTIGIQLGSKHITYNDTPIKYGKVFKYTHITTYNPADHSRPGNNGGIASG